MSFSPTRKHYLASARRLPGAALPQNISSNAKLSLLRRFEPLARLDWHSLATLARLANELAVPATRLLVRPPRRLDGVWYLCAGSVVNELSGERLVAGSARCRRPIYPGQSSLRCLSAVRLLYFTGPVARQFGLFGALDSSAYGGAGMGGPGVSGAVGASAAEQQRIAADTVWLEALASSPVLRLLYRRHGASGWQRWLRELKPMSVARGESVVAPGAETECFYVVRSGVAVVDDVTGGDAKPLATVLAGGFFGEDAVLTKQPRNARVHMPFGGRVLCGEGDQLRSLVADVWWALARNPDSWQPDNTPLPIELAQGLRLSQEVQGVEGVQGVQELRGRLDGLGKSAVYGVSAQDDRALMSLALLLLTHRGFQVVLRDAPAAQELQDVPVSESVMQTL